MDSTKKKFDDQYSQMDMIIKDEEAIIARLVTIWKAILELDDIGLDESFIKLGGHSLKAVMLEVQIEKEFDVEITISDIYNTLTIRELAKLIMRSDYNMHIQIEKADISEYYPLTAAQKGVYAIESRIGASTNFNLPIIKVFPNVLQRDKLETAFKSIIKRHESFRTTFHVIDNEIVQKVHENSDFHLEYLKVDNYKVDNIIKEFIKPFDLESAPLLRAMLLDVAGDKQILVIDMHHIVVDGTSMIILLDELTALYTGNELPPLLFQYKDFSVWQKNMLETDYIKTKEEYWRKKLEGELPALDLPLDFIRLPDMNYNGDAVKFTLPRTMVDKLIDLAAVESTTIHTLFFSGYALLLSKCCSQDDLIIGSIAAGRNYLGLEKIIGMFINVLPIRVSLTGEESISELIKLVHEACMGAYENQDFTFDMIMENLVDPINNVRDSANPLFNTMFVYHNEANTRTKMQFDDFECEGYGIGKYDSKMDIQVDMFMEDNGDISGIFEYDANLFKRDTVERMVGYFKRLMEEISNKPNKKISDIQMISSDERLQLVNKFNETSKDYSNYKPLHKLFEEQAVRVPDNVAISHNSNNITYGQLNEKANRLARYLDRKGIEKDNFVSILLERSPLVIESICAIWKAGGAYIPIDPAFPEERIIGILEDSKSNILITESKYVTESIESKYNGHIIKLDVINEKLLEEESGNIDKMVSLHDLAYVIYTSGSTGKPKGAMIEHLGMINHIQIMLDELNITEESIIAQNAPYCFDISVWQLVAALAVGGKITIYDNDLIVDPNTFINHIFEDSISILEVVPSFLSVLLDCLETSPRIFSELKYLIVTGEAVKTGLIKRWFAINKTTKVVNAYGPAEASDDVTFYMIDDKDSLDKMLIGKPLQNINIYIVDKHMNLCPIGVYGEICVAGISVGRGYINDPLRTSKVFINDPFTENKHNRLYKTGDLGRWLPDGNIEYLGRRDYQVKIRGFRIELGEIENILLQCPGISEAAIVDKDDEQGSKYICTYYATKENIQVESIRGYLVSKLPEYMIPQKFVQLDNMPLSPNGKVDRKALKAQKINLNIETTHTVSDNEIERILVKIWCDILNVQHVGADDNFFMLGGNSIKAIMVVHRINQNLMIEVPVSRLFKTPTIKDIANYILLSKRSQVIPIEKVEQKEFYACSSNQKRMYVINKLNPDSINYNITLAYEVNGKLDVAKAKEVLNKLVIRHEALRTSFYDIDGDIYQKISDRMDVELDFRDAEEDQIEKLINEFPKCFDLNKAPLARFGILNLKENKQIFIIDIHHIICDAISNITLIKEFLKLYYDENVPEIKLQYKDFAAWQNSLIKSDSILKQEQFWVDSFSGGIPEIALPLDFERPEFQNFEGNVVKAELDSSILKELSKLAEDLGVTNYMILFAAFKVLLAHYSCQEELVVGTPITGRTHPDLDNVVGMFVNTMAIKSYPKKDITFMEYLDNLKEILIASYENQDYPFEMLVEKLNVKRVPNRNPIFDVAFSFYDAADNRIQTVMMEASEYPRTTRVSIFDITLYALLTGQKISLEFEYCSSLFKVDTISKMAEHYIKILKAVVNNTNIKIKDIEIEEVSYQNNDIGILEFNFD